MWSSFKSNILYRRFTILRYNSFTEWLKVQINSKLPIHWPILGYIYNGDFFFWFVLISSLIHFNNLFQYFSVFVGLTVIFIQNKIQIARLLIDIYKSTKSSSLEQVYSGSWIGNGNYPYHALGFYSQCFDRTDEWHMSNCPRLGCKYNK